MPPSKVFVYAEYQACLAFSDIDWQRINVEMKKFKGLVSKTWLSGINTHSVGGFYEFDSLENAQTYINKLLIPFATQISANLSVKLFDGDIVRDASTGMNSPYFR